MRRSAPTFTDFRVWHDVDGNCHFCHWQRAPLTGDSVMRSAERITIDAKMNETPAWFDRTFAMPYPAELLPLLLTRLCGAPARLEEMTRSTSPARLVARRGVKWSAQENAGHLLDLEPLWLARVHDYGSARSELTVADLTNSGTDAANHNARPVRQILNGFRSARETLVSCVTAMNASLFDRMIQHPRLRTAMTLTDHLYFVAEHDDHHLARIRHLLG